jgi:HJR/Mrr/RecB family endonuclease
MGKTGTRTQTNIFDYISSPTDSDTEPKETSLGPNNVDVERLSGYEFEELVAQIMRKQGYDKVRVQKKSGDIGKDIIMAKEEDGRLVPVVVQCKHTNLVGRPVIQQMQGAMRHELRGGAFVRGKQLNMLMT